MEKPLWIICITHMFLEVYLLVHVALIPVITREFQLSLFEASLVATIPNLAQLLMIMPSGFLADHLGTNHLLFISMLVEGSSAFMISQTGSFWTLVLGASLLKIASPLYHISGLSQISRVTTRGRMGKSMGFHNAFGSLGASFGVLSLALFLSTLGWRWTYLFWAFPILAWGFVLLTSPQLKTQRTEKTEANNGGGLKGLSLIFSSGLLGVLIFVALREVGASGSSTFMTTYFVNARFLSESTASLIFGLGPFLGIFGSLGGGYLSERMGAKRSLAWIIFCCAVSLFMLSFASQLYLLTCVYLLFSFFSYAVWAPLNTLVAYMTPTTAKGLGFSFYFLTEGLMASVAPTLTAMVIELSDVWYVFPFGATFLILSLIALQFLPRPKAEK